MKNKKWLVIGIAAVIGVTLFLGCCLALVLVSAGRDSGGFGRNRVALIHLTGLIAASSDSAAVAADPESLINTINKADQDPSVKAILLRVNSPGGVASASQEIAMQLARVRKPVVVSVADVCASGAYMISAEADKIVAPPAADVGSIGVIMEVADMEKLARKLGISMTIIKQGKYKDMGNPFRKLTPEERRILQSDAKITYEQFISQVAKARGLPATKVRQLATGRSWTAQEAKDLGLVDEIGNYQDAIDLAARLGKIKGRPNVVEYESPSLMNVINQLAGSTARAAAARALGFDERTTARPVRQ